MTPPVAPKIHLHEHQREFVESSETSLLLEGGVGGGKTFALLAAATRSPRVERYRGLLLAPTRRFFDTLRRAADDLLPLFFGAFPMPEPRHCLTFVWGLPDGGEITIGSWEDRSLWTNWPGTRVGVNFIGLEQVDRFPFEAFVAFQSMLAPGGRLRAIRQLEEDRAQFFERRIQCPKSDHDKWMTITSPGA